MKLNPITYNFFNFLHKSKEDRSIPFIAKVKFFPDSISQDDIDNLRLFDVFTALKETHGDNLIRIGKLLPQEMIMDFSEMSCFGLLRYADSTRDFVILSRIIGKGKINLIKGSGISTLLLEHNPIQVAAVFGKRNMLKLTAKHRENLLNSNDGNNGFRDLFKQYGLI